MGFEVGIASIVAILVLIYSGMHVAVALAGVSFIGVWILRGRFEVAVKMVGLSATETIASYIFGVIPLFVLMGLLVSKSGIGRDTFAVANRLLGWLRGGVGVATVVSNAIFAAVTGISIASAAVFTKIAVPEMLRLGYAPKFAVGIVAGSSILGMLIPPSLLLILFAVLAEQSVKDMFLAGVIPGILMAIAFASGILFMAWKWPSLVGDNTKQIDEQVSLTKAIPIFGLIFVVLGGIYGGIFTPTEAGAIGAFAALLLTYIKGNFKLADLFEVVGETGQATASICLLIIGANMYTRMLTLSGFPNMIGDMFVAANFSFAAAILMYVVLIVLMGTILDAISIMLIMVPIALPVFLSLGADPVWFGLITVVAVEIGIITPPLGIAVFVIKGSLPDDSISLSEIFSGALPFVLIMMAVLFFLVLFPQLSIGLL